MMSWVGFFSSFAMPRLSHRDLVPQPDFAPLARRSQQGQANFERGGPPAAVVRRRAAEEHRVAELVDHFRARHDGLAERFDAARIVAIYRDPHGCRTHVAALAAGHDEAEVLVPGRLRR